MRPLLSNQTCSRPPRRRRAFPLGALRRMVRDMKREIPLATAQDVAGQWLSNRLAPHCERVQIAGSIRRECPTVGDIGIVAIPRPSFFETMARLHDSPASEISILKGLPGLQRGRAKYIQIRDSFYRIQLDVFLASRETWGVVLAIRTGSAEFSRGLMIRANRIGLTSFQSRLVSRAEVIYGKNGKPKAMGFAAPLETPEERDVFEALKIRWVEPENRHGFQDIKPLQS